MGGSRMVNAYRFFTSTPTADQTGFDDDEFDESDIWGLGHDSRSSDLRISVIPPFPLARRSKSQNRDRGCGGGTTVAVAVAVAVATSLPLNIPDWRKIVNDEQNRESEGRKFMEYDVEEDDDDDNGKGRKPVIPPHELLWRSRAASFSVHEGVGRTLKGRDLSRLRDTIWERIGFED